MREFWISEEGLRHTPIGITAYLEKERALHPAIHVREVRPEYDAAIEKTEAKLKLALGGINAALDHLKTLSTGDLKSTTQIILEHYLDKIKDL